MACFICGSTRDCSFLASHPMNVADTRDMKMLYKAQERIYLNRDGEVCDRKDPRVSRLLVPVGGTLTWEEAVRLGLVDSPAPTLDVEEQQARPGLRLKRRGKSGNQVSEDKG
jgi:hypothetical protein